MAVAFDATSNSGMITSPASFSFPHTCGSGANRIIVLCVEIQHATVTVSAASYGGVAMTFLRGRNHASAPFRAELWYLVAPATGANTVSVTLSGTADFGSAGVCTFNGVDQATPINVSNDNAGGVDTAALVTLVTSVTDTWIVDILSTNTFSGTWSSTRTSRWAVGTDTFGASASSNAGEGVPAAETAQWNSTANKNWVIAALALTPAGWGPLLGLANNRLVVTA